MMRRCANLINLTYVEMGGYAEVKVWSNGSNGVWSMIHLDALDDLAPTVGILAPNDRGSIAMELCAHVLGRVDDDFYLPQGVKVEIFDGKAQRIQINYPNEHGIGELI